MTPLITGGLVTRGRARSKVISEQWCLACVCVFREAEPVVPSSRFCSYAVVSCRGSIKSTLVHIHFTVGSFFGGRAASPFG